MRYNYCHIIYCQNQYETWAFSRKFYQNEWKRKSFQEVILRWVSSQFCCFLQEQSVKKRCSFLSVVTAGSTHWCRVMRISIGNLTIIGSDNGLVPGRCQAIIRTNAGIFLNGPLGTKLSEILIKIHKFLFKKMHLKSIVCKMLAILSRP